MESVSVVRLASVSSFLAIALSTSSRAQVTSIASVTSSGGQANNHCERPSLSADGRFVVFESESLAFGPNANFRQVYLRDREGALTERISVDPLGVAGNGTSQRADVSADGRFVVFESVAPNLVPGDTNGVSDVFVRDRQTGTTERVSPDAIVQSPFGSSLSMISDDGSLVGFVSGSSFVPEDTNGQVDVYLVDRVQGSIERVSVGAAGQQGNFYSGGWAILSADGRYVTFTSSATNLVAGDTNDTSDVYLRDRLSGVTERISIGSAGEQPNSFCNNCSVSPDGRFVVFTSNASNLVPNDTNQTQDVFLRDRQAGTTERISVSSSSAQGTDQSYTGFRCISADGRYVAFVSRAPNLVTNDTNQRADVFLRDRLNHRTYRENLSSAGVQSGADSFRVVMTPDVRHLAFDCFADLLVAGDADAATDVFLRDRGNASGAPFCVGDGSGAACPCGNATPPSGGAGCANSTGAGGRLEGSGAVSVASDSFVLAASGMSGGFTFYFQGSAQENDALGLALGDGLRCAGGSTIRLATVANVAGSSAYPGTGNPSISSLGLVQPGETRAYQSWYRDPASFCTSDTYNYTSAWVVTWKP